MAKRRHFTPEFKARLVLDVLTGVQSQAEACRKHALGPNLLGLWKATFLEKAHLAFDNESARSAEQVRIAELEQVLGRMTLENEILKKQRSAKELELRHFPITPFQLGQE
jgi:transposase